MNKKCKRIISSVLSFTMILGCMVFNDVGVIQAAETKIAEYDFNTGDSGYLNVPEGIVNITGTTVTTGQVDETADMTVNKSGGSQDAHGFRLNADNSIILRNIRGASDETLPVKVTIGGCSWGSTFTVTDGDSFEKSGLSNNIGGCWHSNKTANVYNIYYNGEKSVLKLTAANQIYIPYLKVSTVSEEEYKAAIIPSSVTLSGTDTIAVGSETQLSAKLAPTNVYPFIDTLKWSSSDETVAEVNENGVVTGKGIGSAKITAASSENADIKGTMTVNVVDPNTKYVVKGEISGVASDKVTSVKIGDTDAVIDEASFTYTAEVVPGKYTVSANAVDGYTLSSLSTAELTVSGDTTRNIHYKKNVVAATDTTVYVDGSDKGANHYDTITQAVAGLKAGSKTSGSTVVLTPGAVYEEQVIVDVPKVKFYCEDSTNLPTVQWYYGIGQTYYSADSTGYYNEERAYDKTQKGKVDRWGCAVRVTASGFSAENVIFKNTFNYNVTQAELDDGVTRDASAYGENTGGIARTDLAQGVQTTAATERAAAIALDGSNAAFENCQFLGSQDTIYSGGNAYFKNCLITGQTDYMFNNGGTVIVDDSVLQWKGYSGTPKAGYITAARGKYIFRNCEITGSDTLSVTPGYYGRPWGTSADVSFIGCKTNGLIVDAGWTSMSGVAPDASMFKENSNTTDGTTAFNSALNATDSEIGTDDDPGSDYNYFTAAWLPFNHTAYSTSEKGYLFDFTTDSGLNLTGTSTKEKADTSGEASVMFDANGSTIKYHGTQHGDNFYSGSQIRFFVTSEDSDEIPVKVTFTKTANAITADVYKADDMTTSLANVAIGSNGDYDLKFTAEKNAEYVIKFSDNGSNNVYFPKMAITTKGSISATAPTTAEEKAFTFAFGEDTGLDLSGTNTKEKADTSGEASVILDANGSYIKYHSTEHGDNFYSGSQIKFYVTSEAGSTVPVKVTFTKTANAITADVYKADDMTTSLATADIYSGGDHDLTFTADADAQYIVKFSDNSNINNVYFPKMVITTTGGISAQLQSAPAEKAFTFAFGEDTGLDLSGTDTKEKADTSGEASVILDANGSYIKYHSTEHGDNFYSGSQIKFYVTSEAGSTIPVKVIFTKTANAITADVYKADDMTTSLATADIYNNGDYDLTFTADVDTQYIVKFSDNSGIGNVYFPKMVITTTGGISAALPVVLGDVNKDGVIDANDAAAILRLVATLSGDYDTDAADADGNGNIELLDAIFYLQNLPVTTA